MQSFADFLLRYRRTLILLLVALTALGIRLSLDVRLEVEAESLLETDDPELEALRRHEPVFPSAEQRFLVAVDLDSPFDRGGEALVNEVAVALRAIPGLVRVVTPRDAVGGRDPIRSRSLRNLLLAENRRTAALVAFLDAATNTTAGRDRVFDSVHAVLDRHLTRDRYAIAGPPFYRREFIRFIGEDQLLFIPITLVMLLALLAVLFRRPLWIALPFVCVFVTLAWTGGVLGFQQRPLTMLTGALPTLLIAIGVTVAIHVLYRYREELHRGGTPAEIARRTVASVGLPCLLSTVTTMVGFGSLVLARVGDIREFGLLAALGVGFAFLVCIVLIPYALSAARAAGRAPPGPASGPDRIGRWLARAAAVSTRRPRLIVGLGILLVVAAGVGVLHVDMDAYLTDDMGESTFIYHSYQFFERRLSSMIPLDVVVEADRPGGLLEPEGQAALAALQRFLDGRPFVDKTLSALDVLADFRTYRPLSARLLETGVEAPVRAAMARLNREAPVGPLTDDAGTVGRIVVLLQDVGARRSFRLYDDIRAFAAASLPPGYRVSESGVSVLANRVVTSLITEGAESFVLAFLVIFVVVTLLFRSLRTGVLCLLGTLVPIWVGVGAMGVMGIVIRTATVIVGSIALGLAIDLTIHLLGRYRRERAAGASGSEALARAMVNTGKPIVVSGGILVLGFGTLGLSRFGLTSEFGIVAAITIFTALVTTLFMLPALLTLGVLRNGRNGGSSPREAARSRPPAVAPVAPAAPGESSA